MCIHIIKVKNKLISRGCTVPPNALKLAFPACRISQKRQRLRYVMLHTGRIYSVILYLNLFL